MSHVLFLSFIYHRYKSDAIIRVYADDRLVDEICLTESIGWKVVDITHPPIYLAEWVGPHNRCAVEFVPEKFFSFEIADEHLRKNIRIEVLNDHNNHTNGFMTQYAYVEWREIFLVPKSLLRYENWMKLKRFFWLGSKDCDTWHPPNDNKSQKYLLPVMKVYGYDNLQGFQKGGDHTLDIPVSKKHGMVHLGKPDTGRIYVFLWRLVKLWTYCGLFR